MAYEKIVPKLRLTRPEKVSSIQEGFDLYFMFVYLR